MNLQAGKLVYAAALIFLLMGCSGATHEPALLVAPLPSQYLVAHDFPNLGPGLGFDQLHERPMLQPCIMDSKLVPVNEGVGPIDQIHSVFQRVRNTADFERLSSLKISVSGSWGSGSGAANYSRFSQQITSNYELQYLIGEEVLDPAERLASVVLTDRAKGLLSKSYDSFMAECGSQIVGARQKGAQFLGILKEQASDNQDLLTEEGNLSLDVQGFVSGDVSALQRIKSRMTTNSLNIQMVATGGATNLLSIGPEEFLQKAKDWANSVVKPADHQVLRLFPYDYPGKDVRSPEYRKQLASLAAAVDRLDGINKLDADVAYVKKHPDEFLTEQSATFLASLAALEDIRTYLTKIASQCLNKDLSACQSIQVLTVPNPTAPTRIPWVFIDVNTQNLQRIGVLTPAAKVRKVIIRGRWSMWAEGHGAWLDPWSYDNSAGMEQGLYVQLSRELGGVVGTVKIPSGGEVSVPADKDNIIVEVMVKDGNPYDNRSDRLRSAVVGWDTSH